MSGLTFTAVLALMSSTTAAPANDSARATLLQLSLRNSNHAEAAARRTAMVEEAALITSCTNAFDLGKRLQARGLHGTLDVNIRTNVALAALPQPLRATLLSRPIGRATPVFGGSEAFRVLVRCEPDFKLPGKITPSPEQREEPAAI